MLKADYNKYKPNTCKVLIKTEQEHVFFVRFDIGHQCVTHFRRCNKCNSSLMKFRINNITHKCDVKYKKMNGQRRYKYIVLGRDKSYFERKHHSDSAQIFSL